MTSQAAPAHTPTPWTAKHNGIIIWICPKNDPSMFGGRTPMKIARIEDTGIGDHAYAAETEKANAAFIVRAVNSHDAMVKALERARGKIDPYAANTSGLDAEIDAALRLARGDV